MRETGFSAAEPIPSYQGAAVGCWGGKIATAEEKLEYTLSLALLGSVSDMLVSPIPCVDDLFAITTHNYSDFDDE